MRRPAKSQEKAVCNKILTFCLTPLSLSISFSGSQSSCACMSGMSPIGGSPESGCQLVSACSVDTCDPTARCQTELNGEPRSDTQTFLYHYLQLGGGPKM